jgi:succinoglycan biosynthesis transport protein ExoP
MDMRSIGGAVWRQRMIALLVLGVTAVATLIGLYYAPRTYTAEATISAATRPDAGIAESDLDSLRATLGELANSSDTIERVQESLSVRRTAEQLREGISGEWVQGTILVEVKVQDRNPQIAAEIAELVYTIIAQEDPSNGVFQFSLSDPPEPPEDATSPNLPLVLGVATLVGLALAGAAAVLRDRQRRRITNGAILSDALSAPVLATVAPPRVATSLPALYPGTEAANVFRDLRIALEAQAMGEPVRKLVVAGARHSDVNVWLAANLAIALAQVDRKVLLIDGRIGDGSGRSIEAPPDTPGLFDVLQGEPLENAVSPGPVDRLSVLPPGKAGGVSHERMVESRFAELSKEATQSYDVVVVIAPALSESQDAVVMAVDGSLLLAVTAGRDLVGSLRAHAMALRSVGVRLLGAVLIDRKAPRARG